MTPASAPAPARSPAGAGAPARHLRPRAPLALRIGVIMGVLALVIAGLPQARGSGATPRLAGEAGDAAVVASILLAPAFSEAVFRDPGRAPTELEIQALAGVAARAPLVVGLPARRPGLTAIPPDAPRTGRHAAVGFTAYGTAGDSLRVRLLDARGAALDSLLVATGADGLARGGFRVRPGREGWTEWEVAVEQGDGDRVGAWVAAAPPPRVLVVAGPPSWESRYVLRALERSGAGAALVQHVGPDQVVTAGGAPAAWGSARSLAAYDVVILLAGAAPEEAALGALEAWVAEGNGVLAAAGSPAASWLEGRGGGVPRDVRGDGLVWTAPAEIAPLPDLDLTLSVVPAGAPGPAGAVAARSVEGDALLTLTPFGRGRVAVLGLRESWRWVMEAGLEAGHRAFWRSVVDWLAVPSADSAGIRLEPIAAGAGATVDLATYAGALTLHRPAGAGEVIPLAPVGERGFGRFVPVDTGLYALRLDGRTVAAFRAAAPDDGRPAELARARLSLLAAASGGEILEADAYAARLAAAGAGDRRGRWAAAAFVLLAVMALAEWALRRLRGFA